MTGNVAARGERLAVVRSTSAVISKPRSALLTSSEMRQHPTSCAFHGRCWLLGVAYVCVKWVTPITQSSVFETAVTSIVIVDAYCESPYKNCGGSLPKRVRWSPIFASLNSDLDTDLRKAVSIVKDTLLPCAAQLMWPNRNMPDPADCTCTQLKKSTRAASMWVPHLLILAPSPAAGFPRRRPIHCSWSLSARRRVPVSPQLVQP
mmetsp:Transcript_65306/g.95645  ORF Transcript_65306/g.95645 Transcript_65306/m.95645 type:complete len:205 (+) Transcript_65306:369-983(+)